MNANYASAQTEASEGDNVNGRLDANYGVPDNVQEPAVALDWEDAEGGSDRWSATPPAELDPIWRMDQLDAPGFHGNGDTREDRIDAIHWRFYRLHEALGNPLNEETVARMMAADFQQPAEEGAEGVEEVLEEGAHAQRAVDVFEQVRQNLAAKNALTELIRNRDANGQNITLEMIENLYQEHQVQNAALPA
jgi:hypothetical protein